MNVAPATRIKDVQRLSERMGAANEVRAFVLLTIDDDLVP